MFGKFQMRDPQVTNPEGDIENDTPYAPGENDKPYQIDVREPGQFPYDVTDDDGADRTNDPLMQDPTVRGIQPNSIPHPPYRPGQPYQKNPQAFQKVIPQTKYDPRDLNQDGHVDEIEKYQAYLKMTPEQRRDTWTSENLLPKGLSADYQTGEIVDAQGNVVGHLPSFE